jgi:hypothetical protein
MNITETPLTDAALFNHAPNTRVASLEVVAALSEVSRKLEIENVEMRLRITEALRYLEGHVNDEIARRRATSMLRPRPATVGDELWSERA